MENMNKKILWTLATFMLLCTTAHAQTIHGDQLRDDTIAEAKLDVANSPTTNYVLSWDGVQFEWQPSGGLTGSGTDNHVVRWDGTGAIQDSGWVLSDTDAMTVAAGTLDLTQTSTTGNALEITRDLILTDTDSPVVLIHQDNVNDNQPALEILQDGIGPGIKVTANSFSGIESTSATGRGVHGLSTDAPGVHGHSTNDVGVQGTTDSAANNVYGGAFESVKANTRGAGVAGYFDADQGAAPAAAPINKVRLYALTGGRMYSRDDTAAPDGIVGPLGSELAVVDATAITSTIAPTIGQSQVTTVDASGGARTITLPAAASWDGQFITIMKDDASVNVVTVDGDGGETINGELTYRLRITNESITMVTDGINWFITAANLHDVMDFSSYVDIKTKNNPSIHGAIVKEADARTLTNMLPIAFDHGQGRVMIVVNAGADVTGTITITGTSVDRDNSENETAFDTEDITIAGLTTDNSANDGLGFNVWDFEDTYISTGWWQGPLTLTTGDVDINDLDVFLINFDQFGDHPNVMIETLEVEGFKTNTDGEMSAHLYSVLLQTGNKYDVQSMADLEHAAAKTGADTRIKMRVTDINVKFDGTTDGLFLEMNMNRANQPDEEDVSVHIHGIQLGRQ